MEDNKTFPKFELFISSPLRTLQIYGADNLIFNKPIPVRNNYTKIRRKKVSL